MKLETLLDGLVFGEGPRWHGDRLWLSDMHDHTVLTVDLAGKREDVLQVAGKPSGLGWLPDGRLLVVSMQDRRLLRREASGALVTHADLSALCTGDCNDMVVDGAGRAYVGNFGFDRHRGEEPRTACLARVDPDGAVTRAAEDLWFPNGTVITPDGRTLIVGETLAHRLTAFDVAADGTLSNRRVWASLDGVFPDGICLDADGCIWVTDARGPAILRVREGGRVEERVPTGDRHAFACMLGGADRRTLFVCTCTGSGPAMAEKREGRIETVRVAVPGAGLP
jgi:sugar lactone lactonase YvrE